MRQNDLILSYLKSGHSLTPLEALNLFGCLRLSGRVYELKRELQGTGLTIDADKTEVGSGKYVASYRLVPSQTSLFKEAI